jgi:hypothetical protein
VILINPYSYAADPWFSSVVLLLHFNGTNGSTTFVDSSTSGKTASVSAGATISTSSPKYGSASGSFNGSGSLEYADSADWDLPGDFTIEGWINPSTSVGSRLIVNRQEIASATALQLRLDAGNTVSFVTRGIGGTNVTTATTVSTLSTSTWTHVAAVRSGTSLAIYLAGVSSATATEAGLNSLSSSRPLMVGRFDDGGGANSVFVGGMDDLRITKGVARYTGNFTPPASQLPSS